MSDRQPTSQPTALVTGAGKRIGRTVAAVLAKAGYHVVLHYHTSEKDCAALKCEIEAAGGKASLVQADLNDTESTNTLIERASKAAGQPLTALINNASLFEEDHMGSLTPALWQRHMTINTLAPLLLTQAFAAQLGALQSQDGHPQNRPGHQHQAAAKGAVVNIIDQRVWRLNPHFMSYTASKAALWALTQTCAQALAPHVRVNAIGPGPVLASIHQSAATFASEASAVPLGRGPSPTEIGETVLYLLSAHTVTGQMIALDGGQHLAWNTPDVVGGYAQD